VEQLKSRSRKFDADPCLSKVCVDASHFCLMMFLIRILYALYIKTGKEYNKKSDLMLMRHATVPVPLSVC